MNLANIKKLIKEEIESMDFLNNNKLNSRDSEYNLLNSKIFQSQFIKDVFNDFTNINIENFSSQVSVEDTACISDTYNDLNLNIEYTINYKFKPNIPILTFIIEFNAENVRYELNCDDNNILDELSNIADLDWSSINVNLYTNDGDKINLDVITNNDIYEKFIQLFIFDEISEELGTIE